MELDMIFTEQINLKIDCLGCGSKAYQEHDSGYYVCINCGTLSTIQHNQELDFNAKNIHRSFYGKGGRRRGAEDDDNDMDDFDTRLNTNYQTSNSENNGMRTPRLSYMDSDGEEVQIRSGYESIIDNQKLFLQVITNICNYVNIARLQKSCTYEDNVKKEIILVAKSIWVDHIKSQTGGKKPKNPKVRSRRNTEDRDELTIKNETSSSLFKNSSAMKITLQNQLNSRKLTKSEILNIDGYKTQKLKSRDKIKKYLEEYDELGQHLNLQNDETLSYNYLLNLTDKKGIKNIEKNYSYEELIHHLFISKQLNYKHLYKEITKTEQNFSPDIILAMIQVILASVEKAQIILFKNIVSFYKNIDYLTNSNLRYNKNEIKLLKFLNKDKLLRNMETMQSDYGIQMDYVKFLGYTCKNILGLPDFFYVSCLNVYNECKDTIDKSCSHLHTKECFGFGVIVYCLKLFYGLNDLTYLLTLKKRNKSNFPSEINDLMTKFGEKDELYKYFEEMPSFDVLLNRLKDLTNEESQSKTPWDGIDFKEPFSIEKQELYLDLITKGLIEHNSSQSYNNNKMFDNFRMIYKQKNEMVMNLDLKKNSNEDVKVSYSMKFKEKFDRKSKSNQKLENSREKLNSFLQDELKFYQKLERKSTKSPGKIQRVNIPLPCDDIVLYKKQSFKFEGIIPSISELIIGYYFKVFFIVDYNILKKCVKIITKTMSLIK